MQRGNQETEAEDAPPLFAHRLTPRINPSEVEDTNSNALQFDWPTDRDLAELMRTQAS
jgi:hypothetical protein